MKLLAKLKSIIRYLITFFNCSIFLLKGKKPWDRGYNEYKKKEIIKRLNNRDLDNGTKIPGFGVRLDERIIEYPWLFSHLPLGSGNLLDAGSALNYDFLLNREPLKSKKIYIKNLSWENNCYWKKNISYIYGDLRNTCFKDSYFDWIVSISTIEHIGLNNALLYTTDKGKNEDNAESYLSAINEFNRILKPGGSLFLTVPFGKKSNHGWFQVFDSYELDRIIATFCPSSSNEYHYRYLHDGWRVSSRELSKDATCFDIHFQKSYDPDYAAFSRAVACLQLIK